MAGNRIDIDLSVQDKSNTLKTRTGDAKELNKQLERSQQLMSGTGTKTGNFAARQAGIAPGMQGPDVGEYNVSRGVAGAGGASARDFADQARGLGGLVRLYATYAANIFAVTAAFNALRDAMQTEAMIKSLDQLGAASGIAMGGLAKQFAAATDGAISLREAAEATAKAMSSGMTQQQFLELGKVAKGAAQALGLNMSDAVSRLTRGITKLEPELLDELGLFTKVGKAADDYARSVGKTEAQLTDFERRQAFANAVLKEGQQKFGEIAQQGNPYDKLLAELKNVAQSILQVVNTIITPIAKLLADNTGLIGAAIGLAALKITKTALPALGEWRRGLEVAAKDAADKAQQINDSFEKAFATKKITAAGIPGLDDRIERAKKDLKIAQDKLLQATGDKRFARGAAFGEATTKEGEFSEKTREKLTENIAKFTGTTAVNMRNYAAEAASVLDKEKTLTDLIVKRKEAWEKITPEIEGSSRFMSELWQREKIRDDAREKAAKLRILSEVSGDVESKGFRGGLRELYNKTDADKDLGRLAKFGTKVQGTMIAAARAVSIFGAALNKAFVLIEIAVTSFFVLDSLFSKNSKQAKEFSDSIDVLDENIKNASLTTEKYAGILTVDSLVATANAFDGVATSVENVAKNFEKADKAASAWDRGLDMLKEGIWFLDSKQEKGAESISKAIAAAIETAPEGELKEGLQTKLQAVLGDIDLTAENIGKVLEGLSKEGFKGITKQLGETLKGTGELLNKSKSLAAEVKDSAKQAQISYQNLANSVRDSSPLGKFIQDNLRQTQALEAAYRDAAAARAALNELSQIGETSAFGTEALAAKELLLEFEQLDKQGTAYKKQLKEQEDAVKKLTESLKGLYTTDPIYKRLRDQAAAAQEDLDVTKRTIDGIEVRIAEINNRIGGLIKKAIKEQLDGLFEQYRLQLSKIAIEGEKARAGLGSGLVTQETIDYQADLAIRSINVEQQLVKVNERLVLATELSRIAQQNLKDELELTRLKEERKTTTDKAKIDVLDRNITNLEKRTQATSALEPEINKLFGGESKQTTQTQLAGLRGLMDREGGTAYFSIVQLLQGQLQREAQAAEQVTTEILKRQLATITKDIDNQKRSLDTQITSYSQQLEGIKNLISGTDSRELSVYLQDLKDRTAQLEIQKGIEQDIYLSENLTSEAARKAAASRVVEGKQRLSTLKTLQDQRREVELINITEERKLEILKFSNQLRRAELEAISSAVQDPTIAEGFKRQLYELNEQEAREIFKSSISRLQDQIKSAQGRLTQLGAEGGETSDSYKAQAAALEALNAQLSRLGETEASRAMVSGLNEAVRRYNDERQRSLDLLEDINNVTLQSIEYENQLSQLNRERISISLEYDRSQLDLRTQMGILTQDEINKENIRLKQVQIGLDLQQKLNDYTKREAELRAELAILNAQVDDSGLAGETAPRGVLQRIKATEDQLKLLELSRQTAQQYASVQEQILADQAKFDDRTKTYGDSFKRMFEGMADAIIDFAKTGKLNFKELINSFIEDIARYELRLQYHQAYIAARPALMSLLGNMFGGFGGYSADTFSAANTIMPGFGFALAKGGAFDVGLQTYAKGGMFTNSIVNQPTLFKAAKGLGVMGEAGPEAIMPLKRDNQGNLGVRANQGSVSVVVNNYSKEQAQTKETVDSRGNRKIEVIVGDIVSQEISRNGSPLQTAFTNSFGAKPYISRR
jgi:lambda family phage tail tape measure protein